MFLGIYKSNYDVFLLHHSALMNELHAFRFFCAYFSDVFVNGLQDGFDCIRMHRAPLVRVEVNIQVQLQNANRKSFQLL